MRSADRRHIKQQCALGHLHEFTDSIMAEGHFGQIYARPQFECGLRIMFIVAGTNEHGEGWSGIELAGKESGGLSRDFVDDGWERAE